jgi:hypothetical protein
VATTAVFTLVGPFIASLLVAVLYFWGRSAAPSVSAMSAADLLLAGFLGAFLPQLGPGLVTGLIMSFASPRIRSGRGWLTWAAVSTLTFGAMAIVLLFSTSYADAGWIPALVMVIALVIPAVLGALASAAATLRIRPRPAVAPTAEVFG